VTFSQYVQNRCLHCRHIILHLSSIIKDLSGLMQTQADYSSFVPVKNKQG